MYHNEKRKQEWVGEALTEITSTYVTIAIETTGFDIESDQILAISAVRYFNRREVGYFTKQLAVENEKTTLILALEQFLNFINDDVLVGHQVDFMLRFLSRDTMKYMNRHIKNDYIDTVYLVKDKPFLVEQPYPVYYKQNQYRTLAECYIANDILCNSRGTSLNDQDRIEYSIRTTLVRMTRRIEELERREEQTRLTEKITNQTLVGKECVFTGKLERMLRGDAKQIVYREGGYSSNTVTNKTDYLVLGGRTYDDNTTTKSTKYRKAERLQKEGSKILIITENEFFSMCNNI